MNSYTPRPPDRRPTTGGSSPARSPSPGGGTPPSPSGFPGSQVQLDRLSQDYWKKGYFDNRGNLCDNFISGDAEAMALQLESGGMTRSLLRNYYNEVCTLRHLVRTRPDDFERWQGRIRKLRGHASNAMTRRTAKAPELFYRFIDRHVDIGAKDRDSFLRGFCEHFECIVLYFKGR